MIKAVAVIFSGDLVAKALLGFASFVLIRAMTPDQYGQFTLAFAYLSILVAIFSYSFSRIYIVGQEQLGFAKNNTSLFIIKTLIVGVGGLLLFPLMDVSVELKWLCLANALVISSNDFIKSIFQQKLSFKKYSLVEVSKNLLFLLTILLLARESLMASQVYWAQGLVGFLVFIALVSKARPFTGKIHLGHSLELLRKLAGGEYKYLIVYSALIGLSSSLDILLLNHLSSKDSVASYGAAFRYYGLLMTALVSVHTVILPLLQKAQTQTEFLAIQKRLFYLVLLFTPVAILLALSASVWIPWIDAGKYPTSINVFQILSVAAIASFAMSPYSNILIRFNRFRLMVGIVLVGILTAFVGNILLVPIYAELGTAVAAVLTALVQNGAAMYFAKKTNSFLRN